MSNATEEIKQYLILHREDYNKKIKVAGSEFEVLSKKKIKSLYQDDEYTIIGEAKQKTKHSKIGELFGFDKDKSFIVTKRKDHTRIFYREVGYVQVDGEENEFIAILKNRLPLFLILLLALIAIIAILIFSSCGAETEPTVTIPPDDPYAQQLDPSQDTPSSSSNEDDDKNRLGLGYTKKATLYLSQRYIKVYFVNPSTSNQHAVLQVYVNNGGQPVLIGSSDLVRAGKGLAVVDFDGNVNLSPGSYTGKYNVIAYDVETNEQAMLEMDIPITITVEE